SPPRPSPTSWPSCCPTRRAPSLAPAFPSWAASSFIPEENNMAKWLKSSETLTFQVADRVARITLNRPDKRNALTPQALAELSDALLEADDRTDVHAIVLAGAGRDFCAGYDLTGAYAGQGDSGGPAYRSQNGTLDD